MEKEPNPGTKKVDSQVVFAGHLEEIANLKIWKRDAPLEESENNLRDLEKVAKLLPEFMDPAERRRAAKKLAVILGHGVYSMLIQADLKDEEVFDVVMVMVDEFNKAIVRKKRERDKDLDTCSKQ